MDPQVIGFLFVAIITYCIIQVLIELPTRSRRKRNRRNSN